MDNLKTQGISMPKLGLGTFRMQGDACRAAVESALSIGYRHIDTAEMYANEEPIGAALAAARLPRGELHVTTKVWHENLSPDAIRRAFDASLTKLRLDHVDLYLVHWPSKSANWGAVFETLMMLKEEGRTRAIGVANFTTALLKIAVEDIKAPIACNQIEYHAMLDNRGCWPISTPNRSRWSPIARSRKDASRQIRRWPRSAPGTTRPPRRSR